MNIRALSRYEMYHRKSKDPKLLENFKIISINDYGYHACFEETHANLLTLFFDDVEPGMNGRLFTSNEAEKIIDFLEKLTMKDNLLVHCVAGISRSGAVGLFASRMFDIEPKYIRMNPQIRPNRHVVEILSSTYMEMNGEIDYNSDNNITNSGYGFSQK